MLMMNSEIKKGDKVITKGNLRFYKNRIGTVIKCKSDKYLIVLENFNDIPMWFWKYEIKKI